MEMRRVEIVSERLLDGYNEYFAGDVKSLPKPKADEWIRLGWAKDPETGEQGDRKPGAVKIDVDAITTAVG